MKYPINFLKLHECPEETFPIPGGMARNCIIVIIMKYVYLNWNNCSANGNLISQLITVNKMKASVTCMIIISYINMSSSINVWFIGNNFEHIVRILDSRCFLNHLKLMTIITKLFFYRDIAIKK